MAGALYNPCPPPPTHTRTNMRARAYTLHAHTMRRYISDKTLRKDPSKWEELSNRISSDMCLWYTMDDATYVNYILATKGDVSQAYSTILEQSIADLLQDEGKGRSAPSSNARAVHVPY